MSIVVTNLKSEPGTEKLQQLRHRMNRLVAPEQTLPWDETLRSQPAYVALAKKRDRVNGVYTSLSKYLALPLCCAVSIRRMRRMCFTRSFYELRVASCLIRLRFFLSLCA